MHLELATAGNNGGLFVRNKIQREQLHQSGGLYFEGPFTRAQEKFVNDIVRIARLPMLAVSKFFAKERYSWLNRGNSGTPVNDPWGAYYPTNYDGYPAGCITLRSEIWQGAGAFGDHYTPQMIFIHEIGHSLSPLIYRHTHPAIAAQKNRYHGGRRGCERAIALLQRINEHCRRTKPLNGYHAEHLRMNTPHLLDETYAIVLQYRLTDPERYRDMLSPEDSQEFDLRLCELLGCSVSDLDRMAKKIASLNPNA